MTMAFDKQNVIDQEEVLRPQMVSVEIAGKTYQVPKGITMIKALWYTGQEVIRGAGCLGGFCGACAAYYRTTDDPKVKTCLACQTAVEDGMSFTLVPPFPARKGPLSDRGAEGSQARPLYALSGSAVVPQL